MNKKHVSHEEGTNLEADEAASGVQGKTKKVWIWRTNDANFCCGQVEEGIRDVAYTAAILKAAASLIILVVRFLPHERPSVPRRFS